MGVINNTAEKDKEKKKWDRSSGRVKSRFQEQVNFLTSGGHDRFYNLTEGGPEQEQMDRGVSVTHLTGGKKIHHQRCIEKGFPKLQQNEYSNNRSLLKLLLKDDKCGLNAAIL